MKRIRILSTKYDGSLRDEYQTYMYKDTVDSVIVFSPPGLKSWDYRKSSWSETSDGLIEIYNKSKWFHVWHIVERISSTIRIYVHIALPARFNSQQLQWTDLDLDYRVHLDNSIELKDQLDFEYNIGHMHYPLQLIENAWVACREVQRGFECGTFPFDHENQVELYYRLQEQMGQDSH